MKKILLTLLFILTSISFSTNVYAGKALESGMINQINYIKLDININGKSYKLSNTVKVYGFDGNKYLNVKKLESDMNIEFKFTTNRGVKTISEIWVRFV
ncbi:MAG: hypothetical protein ACC657_02015 [Thiohalomonadales bacterium]